MKIKSNGCDCDLITLTILNQTMFYDTGFGQIMIFSKNPTLVRGVTQQKVLFSVRCHGKGFMKKIF